MIKHRAYLSVIALLMALLLGGCIMPDGAPLAGTTTQPAAEASESQSIVEVLGQDDATPASDAAGEGKVLSQVDPSADAESLSTPELIEQAFAAGEINAEERILYLTYAIYEYDSLPPAYQSNVPWRGTMIVLELNEFLESPAFCELTPDVQSELERLLGEPACKSS